MTTFDKSLFAQLSDESGYARTNERHITNPYVNFLNHENTKTLQDVLVAESIQMRGIECYYLPREFVALDELFGEDLQSKFNKAWKFAAYLNTYDNYEGANTLFSKFGMSVNDEMTLSINPNLFKYQCDGKEPIEGDLIYFTMDNSLFEITWVEPYNPFYQVGANAIRRITAQKFIYSGEEIKPELQLHDELVLTEFDPSELEPIHNLNGRKDLYDDEFKETKQIQDEASEFIDPYVVMNNKGIAPKPLVKKQTNSSPFDNFMDD